MTEPAPTPPKPDLEPPPGSRMAQVNVGPMMSLPWVRLGLGALGGGVAVGAAGWIAVGMFAPLPHGPWVLGVWLGVAAAVFAHWIGIASIRPWRQKRLRQWGVIWLMGRAVSFVGVLILAALLYSAAQPRPLAFGLAIAAGYFAALLAEVAVYAAHVRSVTGEGADAS